MFFVLIYAQEGKFSIMEEVIFHFRSLAVLLENNCNAGLYTEPAAGPVQSHDVFLVMYE